MNKLLRVARREYFFNLKRPGFLFAVFGVPLFVFVIWFVIFAVISRAETDVTSVGTVGLVDQAGVLKPELLPPISADLFVAYADDETARAALDTEEIGAYAVITENYRSTGVIELYSRGNTPAELQDRLEDYLLASLSGEAPPGAPVERIREPIDLTVRTTDTDRVLTEANIPALLFLPLIFAFVLMMSAGVTSGFVMSSIVEERTNRIMEILVTSVTPMQLLLGKILGLGLLGLTQLAVWVGGGLLLLRTGQSLPALAGVAVPLDMLILFVLYFVLSYFLLASLQAAIGVITVSEQESRQFASILSILFVIPFFFIISFLEEPNGTTSTLLSLIPFTSPMAMLMRVGFAAVPLWQVLLSLGLLVLLTIISAWAAARIFRWGLLLYGKRMSVREIWRVLRGRQDMPIAAPSPSPATQN